VTNYVMMETGQPLHAFDYHLIEQSNVGQASSLSSNSLATNDNRAVSGTQVEPSTAIHKGEAPDAGDVSNNEDRRDACPTIVIRRATAGEKFTTLDEQEHTLTMENLLIADETKGIALAGVMGGLNTEINDQTVDVLIESAYFNPTNIRRTSKALGLRTDSSYRFERGADIGICDWASQRAAQLILETAGGSLAEGVVDAYPEPVSPQQISLRPQKVTDLLGIILKPDEISFYLTQLGLKAPKGMRRPTAVESEGASEPLTFEIPTFRVDLKREVDLIEEVCRLHGIDKIPSTPPRGAHGSNEFDSVYDQIAEARRILTGLGLNEAQGQTLVSKSECKPPRSRGGVQNAEVVALANPLSSDMDVLRPSLLPGLIHSLRHNVTRKNGDVALFEIGKVFQRRAAPAHAGPADPIQESCRLAIALTGQRSASFWSGSDRDAKFDTSDLKGIVEEFLELFGVRGVQFTRCDEPGEQFVESATVAMGGKLALGELGLLHPAVARKHDLRDPVLLAELDIDVLLARRNPSKSFKPLPQFPAVRRDVAMLVPEATTHGEVLGVVCKAKPANLESVDLFDVFRGKHVPEGQKSLAYAFTYRAAEKTLTDNEVNAAHDKVVEALKAQLNAVIR